MSVPNTNTFTLQNVTTEIYGDINSSRNLFSCFNNAELNKFDINYRGNLDRLSSFRNYGITPPLGNTSYELENGSATTKSASYKNSSGGNVSISINAGDFVTICAQTGSVAAPAGVAVTSTGSC